ncbi:hypothetical protein Gogos_011596 [Gossypium gossypioides]|uniref:Uncharacterized protein n=1 Tax=Gossypium gossypioides TaxID=34282 RepID=A0A7J9BPW0_GOSGO|nr:hypothetical protein [Gossypium gossypioides]
MVHCKEIWTLVRYHQWEQCHSHRKHYHTCSVGILCIPQGLNN